MANIHDFDYIEKRHTLQITYWMKMLTIGELDSKLHFPGETSQITTFINIYKWLNHTYIFQTFIEDFHG